MILAHVTTDFDAPNGPTLDECITRARELDHDGRHSQLLVWQGLHRQRIGRPDEAQLLLEQSLSTDLTPSVRG